MGRDRDYHCRWKSCCCATQLGSRFMKLHSLLITGDEDADVITTITHLLMCGVVQAQFRPKPFTGDVAKTG